MLGNVMNRRQIWAFPSATITSAHLHCTPFTLPSKGVLTINHSSVITLSVNAVFAPECTGGAEGAYHANPGDPSSVADLRDPFYASTSPQIYAIAAATVVSYLLVIMLFITPRTFFVGGPGGGSGFLGPRGIISGSYGSTSVVGVGRRPWLQKVAALTVAISLTIATADTFKVAERQYEMGYMDANALTDEVVGGLEIRIVRVTSTTFLWLAQVQTLIRLFPRHKEKVIIKWTGFALIVLDTIFSILNSFVYTSSRTRPRLFIDAVPALSYLFELSLSLLYAAWVIYYSICKRRFAFFHIKMRNICLVALLSLSAVLVPVVFFVLDISKPDVAGWGDYVRWVGAAAASVVVWEWVERIEALERDERKDGILGREVFDGDEMLEVTPSAEIDWPRHPPHRPGGTGVADGSSAWDGINGIIHRPMRSRLGFQQHPSRLSRQAAADSIAMASGALPAASQQTDPTPPPATTTPISRADTTSAASTIYAVRDHHITGIPHSLPEEPLVEEPKEISESPSSPTSSQPETSTKEVDTEENAIPKPAPQSEARTEVLRLITAYNPFKRRRASPPPEVAIAQAGDHLAPRFKSDAALNGSLRWNVKSKIENFAVSQIERLKSRNEGRTTETSLPVTIIPAQPRGHRTWSPQYFEDQTSQQGNSEAASGGSHAVDEEQPRAAEPVPSASTNSYYVPLPAQPGPPPTRSFDSNCPKNSNNRVLTRRGTLTIAEENRNSTTSLAATSSPMYRHLNFIQSTAAQLAPIPSVPSPETSISLEPESVVEPFHPSMGVLQSAPPILEIRNSTSRSYSGHWPQSRRASTTSEAEINRPRAEAVATTSNIEPESARVQQDGLAAAVRAGKQTQGGMAKHTGPVGSDLQGQDVNPGQDTT